MFGCFTLEVVWRTTVFRTVSFILFITTVILAIASQVYWDTLLVLRALELPGQTHMCVTVQFIRIVPTVVLSITDKGRKSTKPSSTLETSRLTSEFRALGGLVGAVATVVHSVTLPPERDALVGFAAELAGGAVGQARLVVRSQVEVGGTGTGVQLVRGQQAQVTAATVVQGAHVLGHIRLPVRVIHLDVCDGVPRVNQGEPA